MQKRRRQRAGAPTAQSLQGSVIRCDGASGGALRLQKAAAFQLLQSALHGVGVDPGVSGQLPHGWNAAAGREPPRDEGKLQLLDQLHIDRAARSNVPVHGVLCSFCIIVLRA